MLSKNKIKYIQSLSRKKNREQEKVFLVEGNKMVLEAIQANLSIKLICCTSDFLISNNIADSAAEEIIEALPEEIKKASLLQSPQEALAVIKMPDYKIDYSSFSNDLVLALDFIQDPGNLGTIIRIANWFGISTILCSENTVDCFNPKVIQASMGAIFRVKVHYVNLPSTLAEIAKNNTPVYGTFLEGGNLYKEDLSSNGVVVLGNEGNGISQEVEKQINKKIHIPAFSVTGKGSESLNVATATAICCSEFRRRLL